MTPKALEAIKDVLEEGGFIQGGKWSSGLIDAETSSQSLNTDLRYSRLLNNEVETESIDIVYEIANQLDYIPGKPAVYFKFFEYQPSADVIVKLRTSVWNQGLVPTLWIITPTTVSIYDSFARPQFDETEETYLLTKLTRIGEGLKRLKEVESFHKRSFDSGAFWQSIYGQKIDRSQRIDSSMLADLSKTMEILTTPGLIEGTPPLNATVAHALLGRAIFISYLEDRSILDSAFFQKKYQYPSFKELLEDKEDTFSCFRWLRDTFNGNLFPLLPNEEDIVSSSHLQILRQFLSGADMHAYPYMRQRLWPYRFHIIPIELISSIYEMFAHSLDPKAAEARSVHYTRLQLVELVLSLAMQGVTHTARVLDPACGSGVFLVEAFRRLAWLRSKKYGRLLQRDELHELLCTQIFGMDIDPDAVNVAAFSLYLALLELDPDPQPPEALKFPYLLPFKGQIPNLYVQDFCNTEHRFNQEKPFAEKGFDIIVGNPPWTALKEETAPRDPEDLVLGRQWGLEYCKRNKIPDRKPDQAFMMRARDFAQSDTKIAFIVASRIFYQQEDPTWLEKFLDANTLETVINLSDFTHEHILFGGESSTLLPASVILYRVSNPSASNKVAYITPKWYPNVAKQDEIVLTAEDIHYLSQRLLKQKPFLWKSAFRGVSRDYRLLNKLQNLPSLGKVLSIANVDKLAHRGLIFGEGEQQDASVLRGKPFLASGVSARYSIDVTTLGTFNRPTIAKRRKPRFLQLPALIISRSLRKGRACIAVVEARDSKRELVIDQMYYGIPYSVTHPELVYRLNVIFNSKLAFYMAFMFSSGLGWDRRLIEVGDWQQIRLPDSILARDADPLWSEVLQQEAWLRNNWQFASQSSLFNEVSIIEDKLDQAVYQLYGLSDQERILVEDTLRYNITPFIERKKSNALEAYSSPSEDELTAYSRRICSQINGILSFSNLGIIPKIYVFEKSSPLCVCQFTQKEWPDDFRVNKVRITDFEQVFSLLVPALKTEIADHLSVNRGLRIYDDQSFWIIKPSEKRLWSETAALSDADAIVREHMEASRLG